MFLFEASVGESSKEAHTSVGLCENAGRCSNKVIQSELERDYFLSEFFQLFFF